MSFAELTNLFIRGAAYSRDEETIFLVEANHSLYALRAEPNISAVILSIRGSVNMEQANFVSVAEFPSVRHSKESGDKKVTWVTRKYNLYTSLGTVEIVLTSDEEADADTLRLDLVKETGYPPEDAKRLEDFE